MRKYILTFLLAGAVAMPAIAQDQAKGRWQRDHSDQSATADDDSGARPTRAERPERPERAARVERVEQVRAERPERVMPAPIEAAREQGGWAQRVRARRNDNDGASPGEARRGAGFERPGNARQSEVRRDPRSGQSFAERLAEYRRSRGDNVTEVPRDRTTPSSTGTRHVGENRQWTRHWRSDRRYDWRRHRDHHRSIFQFGNYWDPYRSSYRRFSIGFNLWPSYYQSNYWLNDPWQYRLPPAYGPYRWVRYYDDALLVNIYSGEVVDVIRDFFW